MKLKTTVKDHFQETLSKILIEVGNVRFGDAWIMVYDYEVLYADILTKVEERGSFSESEVKQALEVLVREYRATAA